MRNIKRVTVTAFVMLIAFYANANAEAGKAASGGDSLSFEQLENYYLKSGCAERPKQRSRAQLLAVLDDVITGSIKGDSFSYDVIGDVNIFSIGRKVNPDLTRLYEYAQRQDVEGEIRKDLDNMRQRNKLNLKDEKVADLVICDLYSVIVGEPAEATDAFSKYVDGLNRKVLHKNLDRLQDMSEGLE